MIENWVLDVSIDAGELLCFCPIEGEIGSGDFQVVTGMNVLSDVPPGKLVGIVHMDGQEAVDKWCSSNPEILEKLRAFSSR